MGGSAITSYTLRCVGPNTVAMSANTSPLTVNRLTNGATYACSVLATSAAGNGAYSRSVSTSAKPRANSTKTLVSSLAPFRAGQPVMFAATVAGGA